MATARVSHQIDAANVQCLDEGNHVRNMLRDGIVCADAVPVFWKEVSQTECDHASLLRQGVLAQITASSLVGMQGRTAQRTAQTLLKQGLVHCIASDAHGLHKRPPAIVQSLRQAVQIVGQEKMQQLIESWPMTIINNVPCRV